MGQIVQGAKNVAGATYSPRYAGYTAPIGRKYQSELDSQGGKVLDPFRISDSASWNEKSEARQGEAIGPAEGRAKKSESGTPESVKIPSQTERKKGRNGPLVKISNTVGRFDLKNGLQAREYAGFSGFKKIVTQRN